MCYNNADLGDVMKKIVFLDIDGVLNDNLNDFVDSCVESVIKLVDKNDASVVMITSLQGNGTKAKRNKLSNMLGEKGINVSDYIDPNFEGSLCGISISSRALGIVDYLKNHSDVSYVILDDEFHNDYKMACLNYYKTHTWKGFQSKEIDRIVFKKVNLNTLSNFKYGYRELGAYEKATNDVIKTLKKVIEKKSN